MHTSTDPKRPGRRDGARGNGWGPSTGATKSPTRMMNQTTIPLWVSTRRGGLRELAPTGGVLITTEWEGLSGEKPA